MHLSANLIMWIRQLFTFLIYDFISIVRTGVRYGFSCFLVYLFRVDYALFFSPSTEYGRINGKHLKSESWIPCFADERNSFRKVFDFGIFLLNRSNRLLCDAERFRCMRCFFFLLFKQSRRISMLTRPARGTSCGPDLAFSGLQFFLLSRSEVFL